MRKNMKLIIALYAVVLLLFRSVSETQAEPSVPVSESNTVVAQQKKKVNVNALYRKYLKRRMVNEQGKYFYEMKKFALLDLNKPELFIQ